MPSKNFASLSVTRFCHDKHCSFYFDALVEMTYIYPIYGQSLPVLCYSHSVLVSRSFKLCVHLGASVSSTVWHSRLGLRHSKTLDHVLNKIP
jgi:hypothetical protein